MSILAPLGAHPSTLSLTEWHITTDETAPDILRFTQELPQQLPLGCHSASQGQELVVEIVHTHDKCN